MTALREMAGGARKDDRGAPSLLSIDGVSKVFGQGSARVLALDRVDLEIAPGELVCLVGASGCGKTTLLNLITGLEQPSAGHVNVGDQRTALLFQEAALFPWLTVEANVELALRLRGVPKRERRRKSAELLDVVHLGGFGRHRPHELSGGMR
ncbi:MAG: ABC transporter ATP-binding protein, partial [Acidimicrobiales bacterium]